MRPSPTTPSKRLHTRPIWIGITTLAMAAGALVMANGAGADDSGSTSVERNGTASAAALTEGATFVPVTPYRAYDSRSAPFCTGGGGPLGPNESRIIDVVTDVNDECNSGIPSENLVAVSYNLTVVSTVDRGFLAVYPAGETWPGNSTINWTQSGQVIANGSVAAVGEAFEDNGFVMVESGPNGSTDFIIDVTGYYTS